MIVELNCNYKSLESIHGCMVVLYGQIVLHRNIIAISHYCMGINFQFLWVVLSMKTTKF